MLKPFLLCLLFCVSPVLSKQDGSETEPNNPLTMLGTDFQNSIGLLQNRFRIDYEIDEITMVFFRDYGSVPVVLIRPDGSKIYQSQADGDQIFWFDTATYDMISIKNPMPGPWQAVGDITPGSRIMVMSDLQLHADPLPDIMFAGEILKQTAYLSNDGKPINYAPFRDVVTLNMQFMSTNNPEANNFGADAQTIASFEDNGKGMDEIPLDGTFTGQFNLSIAEGEWTPTFVVTTPMFSRQQIDPPITLFPNPINITVEKNQTDGGYHKLLIDADRTHVNMSTLLIDGKVQFPNGDIQNFSITEMSPEIREYAIADYEYGVFRIKLTAFGNTLYGRDFILDVPEFSFLTEQSSLPMAQNSTEDPVGRAGVTTSDSVKQPAGPHESDASESDMNTGTLVTLIVSLNLFLLIVGAGLIWFISKNKPIHFSTKHDSHPPSRFAILAKLKQRLTKTKKAQGLKNTPKAQGQDNNPKETLDTSKDS